MNCSEPNCRNNPSSDTKAPCETCREKMRKNKGRTGTPQQSLPAQRQCQTCKRFFLATKLTDGACQSCFSKQKIVEILITHERQSDAKEILFAMHFDELGQPVLYKSFFTTDTHQELCKTLQHSIHPDERNIDTICALDVHNVYNTGGSPLDHNHLYIGPLRHLPSTTLRVLISYMGDTSTDLRVNVEHYAYIASLHNAIDFCFLVFQRTHDLVEKTEHPASLLDSMKHGTKAGLLQTLCEIYTPKHIRFADDSDDHCTSVQKTFPHANVKQINKKSSQIEMDVISAILD